ncbi:MAG: methylisocitrate lyase [Rhodospirillales bacterium]|nr:methylisocitrate lyase [Rhodospirillales bacterium]
MTWLERDDQSSVPAGDRFADLLARDGILRLPGAHNAMAGLLAKDAGFDALYVSGAAVCASMGLPDLGILTLEELCLVTRSISRTTGLPILADGDTGYGEALNAMRLVRELEQAGAAAVQIEDQVLPKKCGHLNDKTLVPPEQMAAKVAAAAAARTHLRIVARTDAFASEGLDGLVSRARLYMNAGADAVFPEALTSAEDFPRVAEALDCPLLANMTEFGRSPLLGASELEAMGYKMVIWPVSSLRIAARAMEDFYKRLAVDGTTEPQLDDMQTRARLYEVIKYDDYEKLDGTIIKSVVP